MQTEKFSTLVATVRFSAIVLAIVILLPAIASAQDKGTAIFKTKCVMCHGVDGEGKTAMGAKFSIPSLSSPEIQKNTDATLLEAITKGKNKMPEFGSKLSAAEIAEVKDFVRKLKK